MTLHKSTTLAISGQLVLFCVRSLILSAVHTSRSQGLLTPAAHTCGSHLLPQVTQPFVATVLPNSRWFVFSRTEVESLGPMSPMFSALSAGPGTAQHVGCAQYDNGNLSLGVYWLAVVKTATENSEMR